MNRVAMRRRRQFKTNAKRNGADSILPRFAINSSNPELDRWRLGHMLAKSFGGKRDFNASCGYPSTIDYDEYRYVYDRGDIGKTIIEAYPNHTWKVCPEVKETEKADEESTPFEEDWKALTDRLPIYSMLKRADVLSGIGRYGGLFLGFDDGKDFSIPVEGTDNGLAYIRPLSRSSMTIKDIVNDRNDPRFGQPETYTVSFGGSAGPQVPKNVTSRDAVVHWSRIIHLADNRDESDVYGVPRLQPLYNRLFDLQKILGGSGEMFWLGAFQGLSFEGDPEGVVEDESALETKIQKFTHGLQRYLLTQGINVKRLAPSVANPKSHVEVQLMFISAVTRIPKRLLIGSERGELSSEQDSDNWDDEIMGRRTGYTTPFILRPFVDRLILHGVLSTPMNGPAAYITEWPDVSAPNAKEKASITETQMKAVKAYLESGAMDVLIPAEVFLSRYLDLSNDVIEEIKRILLAETMSETREEEVEEEIEEES